MSDENDEIINEEEPANMGGPAGNGGNKKIKQEESEDEQDEVHKLLNFKTARILGVVFVVVLIAGLVLSYIQFQNSSDRKEHSKYFWLENNIPKGYPDTVYQKKIIYLDSSIIRTNDSISRAMAVHDSTSHDTLSKK